jgi:uncharacterized membrane protein
MEPDETPMSRPPAPKAEATPTPTEAELSRIAREAVRQPADPRLDRQLERMGLTDAPAAHAAAAPSAAPTIPVAADPGIEDVQRRLRRVESITWVLVVAVVILALAVVVLLAR